MRPHAAFKAVLLLSALSIQPAIAHAAAPTACQLLNAQAAASLLDTPVNPPMDAQGILCLYSGKQITRIVSLHIEGATMGASDFATTVKLQGNVPGGTSEVVAGVGEQNKFFFFSSDHSALMVLYHGRVLTLGVERMKLTPVLKDGMIQTMKQMLAKL